MSRVTKVRIAEITTNQKLSVAANGPGRNVSSTPTLWMTDVPGLSARKGAGHPATARGSQLCAIEASEPYSALSSVAGLVHAVATETANASIVIQSAFAIRSLDGSSSNLQAALVKREVCDQGSLFGRYKLWRPTVLILYQPAAAKTHFRAIRAASPVPSFGRSFRC